MRVGMSSRGLSMLGAVALLCLVLGLAVGQQIAWAASFTVDSTVDAADATPGNGFCATSAGACTLRAAIQEANTRAGAGTINVPAGVYTLTIVGGDDLGATGDTAIVGAGRSVTIVDGGAINRVLETWDSATSIHISNLTIRNGQARAGQSAGGLLVHGQARRCQHRR